MQERRQLVSSCQEKAAEHGWERTGTINRRQKKEISFPLDILVLFSFKKSILILTAGCSDSLCDALLFFLVYWMPGPYKKVLQFTSSPTQLTRVPLSRVRPHRAGAAPFGEFVFARIFIEGRNKLWSGRPGSICEQRRVARGHLKNLHDCLGWGFSRLFCVQVAIAQKEEYFRKTPLLILCFN